MVVYNFNLSTQEAEAGVSQIEFQNNQAYIEKTQSCGGGGLQLNAFFYVLTMKSILKIKINKYNISIY